MFKILKQFIKDGGTRVQIIQHTRRNGLRFVFIYFHLDAATLPLIPSARRFLSYIDKNRKRVVTFAKHKKKMQVIQYKI